MIGSLSATEKGNVSRLQALHREVVLGTPVTEDEDLSKKQPVTMKFVENPELQNHQAWDANTDAINQMLEMGIDINEAMANPNLANAIVPSIVTPRPEEQIKPRRLKSPSKIYQPSAFDMAVGALKNTVGGVLTRSAHSKTLGTQPKSLAQGQVSKLDSSKNELSDVH